MFPEWKTPELTVEKLQQMSHEEIEALLKKVYLSAKRNLPDGPEKKLTLKLGRVALELEEFKANFQFSTEEEQRSSLMDQINVKFKEASQILAKILVLVQAERVVREVEIEPEETNDPWDTTEPVKTVKKCPREVVVEKSTMEYDPWAE